jgi:cell surface protein SprA
MITANTLFENIINGPYRRNNGLLTPYPIWKKQVNVNGIDFEKINSSRKLAPTEYTFHKQLGYITLSRKLQSDEALVVAYEYTYNGKNYKVGELSEDYANRPDSDVIFLKLLRTRDYFPSDNAVEHCRCGT